MIVFLGAVIGKLAFRSALSLAKNHSLPKSKRFSVLSLGLRPIADEAVISDCLSIERERGHVLFVHAKCCDG